MNKKAPAAKKLTVTDDRLRLRAVLERPGREPGPLMIVLHGLTSNKDKLHTLAACEAMREAGFATLRFDLYGHGESDGEFKKHTLLKWISNTLAVMEYAGKLELVTELWLSGHSQGGLVAALVGGMYPDRVRGMVLRAPAFQIPEGARAGVLLGRRFDPCRIPDEFPLYDGVTLEGTYIRAAQLLRVEPAQERFTGPVLLLHGDEDELVPVQDSRQAAERYADCRLEVLQGESHHFDRRREQMRELIRQWLQEKGRQL